MLLVDCVETGRGCADMVIIYIIIKEKKTKKGEERRK
jgi:hypothetical protein